MRSAVLPLQTSPLRPPCLMIEIGAILYKTQHTSRCELSFARPPKQISSLENRTIQCFHISDDAIH